MLIIAENGKVIHRRVEAELSSPMDPCSLGSSKANSAIINSVSLSSRTDPIIMELLQTVSSQETEN